VLFRLRLDSSALIQFSTYFHLFPPISTYFRLFSSSVKREPQTAPGRNALYLPRRLNLRRFEPQNYYNSSGDGPADMRDLCDQARSVGLMADRGGRFFR
jgi:hypothetical protein